MCVVFLIQFICQVFNLLFQVDLLFITTLSLHSVDTTLQLLHCEVLEKKKKSDKML